MDNKIVIETLNKIEDYMIKESSINNKDFSKLTELLVIIRYEAINFTDSSLELKTFDIHECINEITKSANKLSPWIVDARKDKSFRYRIKKSIDKMLYTK